MAERPLPPAAHPKAYVGSQRRVALAIVQRYDAGETLAEIAADYDLSQDAVSLVLAAWDDGEQTAVTTAENFAEAVIAVTTSCRPTDMAMATIANMLRRTAESFLAKQQQKAQAQDLPN